MGGSEKIDTSQALKLALTVHLLVKEGISFRQGGGGGQSKIFLEKTKFEQFFYFKVFWYMKYSHFCGKTCLTF